MKSFLTQDNLKGKPESVFTQVKSQTYKFTEGWKQNGRMKI